MDCHMHRPGARLGAAARPGALAGPDVGGGVAASWCGVRSVARVDHAVCGRCGGDEVNEHRLAHRGEQDSEGTPEKTLQKDANQSPGQNGDGEGGDKRQLEVRQFEPTSFHTPDSGGATSSVSKPPPAEKSRLGFDDEEADELQEEETDTEVSTDEAYMFEAEANAAKEQQRGNGTTRRRLLSKTAP